MKMEPETVSAEAIAKRLWRLTRVIARMMRKGFADSNLCKRTNKLAAKSVHSLLLAAAATGPHLSASSPSFSCKSSNDAISSFVSLKDYEFSCSNSPANHPKRYRRRHCRSSLHETATLAAVQRVLDAQCSPEIGLPGFGGSPAARQLRITDSPFPVKENEEERLHVNKAADEFIKRFYCNLRLQKSLTIDSPFRDTWNP